MASTQTTIDHKVKIKISYYALLLVIDVFLKMRFFFLFGNVALLFVSVSKGKIMFDLVMCISCDF